MKIEEFIMSATRYNYENCQPMRLRAEGVAAEVRAEIASLGGVFGDKLFGCKCPRALVALALSARDSGKIVDGGIAVGFTISGRALIGPAFRLLRDADTRWDSAERDEDGAYPVHPELVADDTWLIAVLEKPASDSAWLQGEEFAGLTFIELEV